MTEGNNEDEGQHFHGGFVLDASQLVAEAQRQHDLHRMTIDEAKHRVFRMLGTLNQEQLESQQMMLKMLSAEGGSYSDYLYGIVTGLLEIKYNICMACGLDHDKAEQALLAQPPSKKPTPPVNEDSTAPTEPYVLTEEDLADMEKYHLDDLRDEDTHQLLGFMCTKCTFRYVSIADRKLKGPDECTGCQIRSAHG